MSNLVSRVIEGTILLVLVYLVLTNDKGFTNVAGAVGSQYTHAVTVLQGRGF
jgi:hypothetical protein